jgi:phosphate transport system substrate-binding protein
MAVGIDDGDGCVKPSLETAQSGEYPLSRPLFIYVNKDSLNEPHVKAFVEFYIRKAATDLVSQVGYVPIKEDTMKENLRKIGVED